MKRIAVLLELNSGHDRAIKRGMHRYMTGKPWIYHTCSPQLQLVPMMGRWRPDGVIGHLPNASVRAAVLALGVPMVQVNWCEDDPRGVILAPDDVAVGRLAAEYLLERGFAHFAFFGFPAEGFRLQRKLAFQAILEAAGKTLHSYTEPATSLATEGWLQFDQNVAAWLKALPKPVAIFASHDGPAAELALLCREVGLSVPDDVALLGVDNDDLRCEGVLPPISSIALPAERLGFEAAAMLDRLMAGEPAPAEPTFLPPLHVVPRQSTDIVFTDEPRVGEAIRYIRENIHQRIGVDHVLEHVGGHRRHLERLFRRVPGRTPHEEICRIRIEQAKRLLQETDLPMTRIAERCGFKNARQLNVHFRKQMELTPSAYRRQFQLR